MDEAKIKEVFSDEEFVKSLFALETPQEVQAAIGAKGLDLSIPQIEMIRDRLISGEGELSEKELDNVAGGFAIELAVACIIGLLAAGVGGTIGTAVFGTLYAIQNRW